MQTINYDFRRVLKPLEPVKIHERSRTFANESSFSHYSDILSIEHKYMSSLESLKKELE